MNLKSVFEVKRDMFGEMNHYCVLCWLYEQKTMIGKSVHLNPVYCLNEKAKTEETS